MNSAESRSSSLSNQKFHCHTGYTLEDCHKGCRAEKRTCIPEKSGQGTAIIVLHGGPDFDHSYLVPDMDRLSESF